MIVGVAIKGDHIIVKLPKPNRHADCFDYLDSIGVDYLKHKIGLGGKNQGFYTHTGKYLDREAAYRYVKRTGQKCAPDTRAALFSEDVW